MMIRERTDFMKKKKYFIYLLLSLLPWIMAFIAVDNNSIFGSQTDWLSQHTALLDYMRKYYQHHSLTNDFFPHLMGGSNAFAFSYYGLYRPDFWIALRFPSIPIEQIIISYQLFLCSLTLCLFYHWLRSKNYTTEVTLCCTLMFACSSLFFQSHRQLMFVNYLPFLVLALQSVDRFIQGKKATMLSISIALIILHSYFYAPTCIIILVFYYFWQKKENPSHKEAFAFMWAIIVGVLMMMFLLLPTLAVLLSNTKDNGGFAITSLPLADVSFQGLLYSPYGCGLTMIAFLALLQKIFGASKSKSSLFLLLIFSLPLIWWILNGTLYARSKILIAFLPLVLLLCADFLQYDSSKKISIFSILLLFVPVAYHRNMWMALDVLLLLFALLLQHQQQKKRWLTLFLVFPILCCYSNNKQENYVEKKQCDERYLPANTKLLENIQQNGYRTADLIAPLQRSNWIYVPEEYRFSSYTSCNNTLFNRWLYDDMKQPIQIKNRVANLESTNIFTLGMMSSRYLLTKNTPAAGYETIQTIDALQLHENPDVLPIFYGSTNILSKEDHQKLSYPANIIAMYQNTIATTNKNVVPPSFTKEEITLPNEIINIDKNLQINEINQHTYQVKAKKNTTIEIPLTRRTNNEIIMIDFIVKNKQRNKDVTITINHMKNKLSSITSSYPNHNNHFTYILSDSNLITNLQIDFSKGEYEISDLQMYSVPYQIIRDRKKTIIEAKNQTTDAIFFGTITLDQDGYFVTSLPYQNGYQIIVDGTPTKAEIVNQAFVGFPLKKGTHQISIQFKAPLKIIGNILSGIGGLFFLIMIWKEKKR